MVIKNLEIGREYEVRLFPCEEIVGAVYVGSLDLERYGGARHCFAVPQIGGVREVLMVLDRDMEIAQDIVTHKSHSSFAIHRVRLNGSDKILEGRLSGLGILTGAGEE